MAVVFDSIGTAAATALNQTSVDFNNLTIGAGANPAILLLVRFDGTAAPTGISFVWDFGGSPQTLSLIGQLQVTNLGPNFATLQLWGYAGPIANRGNRVLHGAWTNGQDYAVDAISFTGADQAGNAFYNFTTASGSGTTPAITLAGATTDQVVALFGAAVGTRDLTAVNNNQIFISTGNAANYAAGAASVAMSATTTASHLWSAIGISVKQPSTIWQGNSRFAGSGAASTALAQRDGASASLLGAGGLSVDTSQLRQVTASVSWLGAGGLSADTLQNQRAGVAIGGLGSLSASLSSTPSINVPLSGAGALSALSSLTSPVAARFAGTGALTAFGSIPGQIAQGVGYVQGTGKLSAFAGIQQSIAARLSGVGALSTLVGKQTSLAAILAGTGGFSGASKFDLFPVVTHSNPVPVGSSNYDPTLSPEDNNARLMMITSNLNDDHAISMPSGAILGRTDSGFGPVQGIRLSAPLVLTADGTVVVDIVTLKTLLGLPP